MTKSISVLVFHMVDCILLLPLLCVYTNFHAWGPDMKPLVFMVSSINYLHMQESIMIKGGEVPWPLGATTLRHTMNDPCSR